jgi:dihydrofolate synthase/folylpolyglutamate synthase
MDFEDARRFLFGLIDYERKNETPNFDLGSFERFLSKAGSPHRDLSNPILIAGTKGKGSTAAFIASVLQAAGYTTGLLTSPHLQSVRERIKVDGVSISEDDFAELVDFLKPLVDKGRSSFRTVFEILTAMAFLHFNKKRTEMAVLEVGMGGRLDATNVVTPILSVLTSVSYDHTAFLGGSLEEIAREKLGIVRSSGTAISAPQEEVVRSVLKEVCAQVSSELFFSGEDWEVLSKSLEGQRFEYGGEEYLIPLLGEHQVENGVLAIDTIKLLGQQGFEVAASDVKRGLREVEWPGRMQRLYRSPLVVVDGAHNGESARALRRAVGDYLEYRNLVLILGISKSKDLRSILDPLSEIADQIIFTRANLPRAETPERLLEAYNGGAATFVESDITNALKKAFSVAGERDLILITGSLYLVGEALDVSRSSFHRWRRRPRREQ